MSTIREDLATAANTVTGIHVSPYFRQSLKPGDGLVRLDRQFRDESGFSFINVWQVVVALPSSIAGAEKYLDAHLDALRDAIATELVVASCTPSQLQIDKGLIPVVVIEGNRAI